MLLNPQQRIIISLISIFTFSSLSAQVNFSTQSGFHYLKGIDAVDLSSDWTDPGFDDFGWPVANAPFRYGDGTGGTELLDMKGNYSTVFLRSTFTVEQLDMLGTVTIGADWDDGFIIWINGNRVIEQQAPATVSYNALSSDMHESGSPEYFMLNKEDLGLVEGENSIAVLVANTTLDGSSDFYFDMSIQAQVLLPELPELPDSMRLTFSHPSGFYEDNFNLTITTPLEGVNIVYTLDGSNPQDSPSSITVGTSASVAINPASSSNRTLTPAVVVRASVVKDGFQSSKPEARTYIYLDQVMTQVHPGGSWPAYNNSNGSLQYMDYDMDPDVVNSGQYAGQMDEAMLDIPSISVITDNDNLFDPQYGIYVNAEGQGYEWERECSVELINPDDSEGFNVNAGLRIRGGWSRHNNYPKHAFRLFFREEYGNSKLEFPLFGDEGVSEFDKVDLRCAQNYSWANGAGQYNTYIREVFGRDSQKDAGQPYTRSRYYHLYLNGMYWGMFQTQERTEARFASDYFGDDKEDYDVIKRSGLNYSSDIIATDGTLDKWREIFEFTKQGFESNEKYYRMEGKDAEGIRIPGAEVYVDIDNLIDYMINIIYSGNYDSPVSAWGGNKSPNNMYAITNREDKTVGFKFFIHDGEHTLMNDATSGPGVGLYENRADIGDRTDDNQMYVSDFNKFHSQWLHYTLSKNEEYRIRFANRAWKQLTGQGIFTPDKCTERFNKRVEQIDMAIIAESARWGDTRTSPAYTKDNAWIPQLDQVRDDYFPFRMDIVIEQLEELDLFPSVEAPVVEGYGEELLDEVIHFTNSMEVTLKNPVSTGDIYYTLDGSDPREIGGTVVDQAVKIVSDGKLNFGSSTTLRTRILTNNKWSAETEITFLTAQTDYSDFKVTEVHYHPLDSINGADTISGKSYEFIEFKNISSTAGINLSGLVIDSAIYYEFPLNYILQPEEYFVVASKPAKFFDRYGLEPSGNYQNYLSNGGEQVLVFDPDGNAIINFIYDDHIPWPEEPDGQGPSLMSVELNPEGNPASYFYWTASSNVDGTPFGHEIILETEPALPAIEIYSLVVYPNPTNDLIMVRWGGEVDLNSTLKIYDLRGAVHYEQDFVGSTEVSFRGLNLSQGIYLVEITSPEGRDIKKVIFR